MGWGCHRDQVADAVIEADPWASDIESGSSLDFLLLYNRETSFVAR
jgi:hypothetical protein